MVSVHAEIHLAANHWRKKINPHKNQPPLGRASPWIELHRTASTVELVPPLFFPLAAHAGHADLKSVLARKIDRVRICFFFNIHSRRSLSM